MNLGGRKREASRIEMKPSPIIRKWRKKKPGDDAKYLFFIRLLPCLCCYPEVYEFFREEPWALREVLDDLNFHGKQSTRTEAAHLGRSDSCRGLGQKYPDREAGPLCADHHMRMKTLYHADTKGFWGTHKIDRDKIIDLMPNPSSETMKPIERCSAVEGCGLLIGYDRADGQICWLHAKRRNSPEPGPEPGAATTSDLDSRAASTGRDRYGLTGTKGAHKLRTSTTPKKPAGKRITFGE